MPMYRGFQGFVLYLWCRVFVRYMSLRGEFGRLKRFRFVQFVNAHAQVLCQVTRNSGSPSLITGSNAADSETLLRR